MPEADLWVVFTRCLNELGAQYMVSGSVAAMLYGEPRLTNDVDIIIFLEDKHIERFPSLFPADQFYTPPSEVIRLETRRPRRGHINLLHIQSGYKADRYLSRTDPLHRWGMERATPATLGEETIMFAPPEYVIIRKLEFYQEGRSEKHLRDIKGMLESSGDRIRTEEISRFVGERGLTAVWAEAQNYLM